MPLPPARFVALVVLGAALAAVSADAARRSQRRDFVRLNGIVRDATSGAPIPGAKVVLLQGAMGPGGAPTLGEITVLANANGRFVVPTFAGQAVEIVASASGYLEGRYGQMWPQDAGRRLTPRLGDDRRDTVVHLWRSASLAGRVIDAERQPVAGVTVHLFERPLIARPRSARMTITRTDRDGRYSFSGLTPGNYVTGVIQSFVARKPAAAGAGAPGGGRDWALVPSVGGTVRIQERGDRSSSYPTTFHPMAADLANAVVVSLEPGHNRNDIDITLDPVAGDVVVAGTVSSPADAPLTGQVRLTRVGNTSHEVPVSLHHAIAVLDAEGRFVFPGIPAGDYELRAEFREAGANPLSDGTLVLSRTMRIRAGQDDLSNLSVMVDRGPGLSGQVHFLEADQRPSPLELAGGSVTLQPIGLLNALDPIPLDASAMFHAPLLDPGLYRLRFTPPSGWGVRTVALDGHDVEGDLLLDANDNDAHSAVITLTNRAASMRLVLESDEPGEEATVFIFPPVGVNGVPPADRMLAIRAAAGGPFPTPPLRRGDYYVVAVSGAVFGEDWRNPRVRRRLEEFATLVTLDDGEVTSPTLPIMRLP